MANVWAGIAYEAEDEMRQISGEAGTFQNTRRWPRHQADLPVRIVALNGILTTPVLARGSKISRAGMALHAPIALKPGDLMQLQFPTSDPSRVTAVVRNGADDCLGLEFLTQLPPDDAASEPSWFVRRPVQGSQDLRTTALESNKPPDLFQGLLRKKQELRQVQKEMEALHTAMPLLADDDNARAAAPSFSDHDSGEQEWIEKYRAALAHWSSPRRGAFRVVLRALTVLTLCLGNVIYSLHVHSLK